MATELKEKRSLESNKGGVQTYIANGIRSTGYLVHFDVSINEDSSAAVL
jgi:hypothetical protein